MSGVGSVGNAGPFSVSLSFTRGHARFTRGRDVFTRGRDVFLSRREIYTIYYNAYARVSEKLKSGICLFVS